MVCAYTASTVLILIMPRPFLSLQKVNCNGQSPSSEYRLIYNAGVESKHQIINRLSPKLVFILALSRKHPPRTDCGFHSLNKQHYLRMGNY